MVCYFVVGLAVRIKTSNSPNAIGGKNHCRCECVNVNSSDSIGRGCKEGHSFVYSFSRRKQTKKGDRLKCLVYWWKNLKAELKR